MFLAEGYAQGQGKRHLGQVWLDGQDRHSQENLAQLLAQVTSNGPGLPVLPLTEFNLSLKQQRRHHREHTLYHFRWWIAEKIGTSEETGIFMETARYSVVSDGYRVVKDLQYRHELAQTLAQVAAIAALRKPARPGLALVFTGCDRLAPTPLAQLQIEEQIAFLLEPLRTHVELRKFYPTVALINDQKAIALETSGVTEVLLWLAEPRSRPSSARRFRWPQAAALTLAGAGAAVAAAHFGGASERSEVTTAPEQRYQQVLQIDPHNVEALTELAALYLERGQTEQAIPVMETIVQQQPGNVEARLNLAKGYEAAGQLSQAEAIYNSVLTEQENNLSALLGKALLLSQQGHTQEAKMVFAQAEAAALSSDVKQQVRLIAQKALSTH
ncbi:MAG: tetratricopeptide repeat protein [Cyanophyceae cyanobacterium]